MPIFEYECKKCGHQFEALLKSASSPAPECPECGASNAKRLLSRFAAASKTEFGFCRMSEDCMAAAKGGCGCGCGCGGHHHH
jgi:putative FmdB family regulatory protein